MKKLTVVLGISILVISNAVFASGLSKPVIVGPKAIGMGGAFVGIADDPTAIFHNPAGMTQLKGHQFQVGFDTLLTDENYTPPSPPTAGTTESADHDMIPVPELGYTYGGLKNIALGFGIFFPHGNGGSFSSPSAVPTNPREGRIYSMEIDPAIAVEVLPGLSFGAEFRFVRVSSALKGQILPFGAGFVTLDDLDLTGWGWGGSFSAFYTPCKYFSFGANYRTKIDAELTGSATFATLGTFQGVTMEQVLPSMVMTGIGIKPIEGLTVGLSYDFEHNSEIENLTATIPTLATVTLPQNWTDSHTIHVGADYRLMPPLAIRAGYAKDFNESIPDTAMNRIVGDIAATEVSAGAAYDISRYTIGLTWNARFGTRTIPVTATNPAPGGYEAFVQMISFAVSAKL